MYVCMYVCVYVCMYATTKSMPFYFSIHLAICKYVYVYVNLCVYIFMNTELYVCMYVIMRSTGNTKECYSYNSFRFGVGRHESVPPQGWRCVRRILQQTGRRP
jgi:hypothetical protein